MKAAVLATIEHEIASTEFDTDAEVDLITSSEESSSSDDYDDEDDDLISVITTLRWRRTPTRPGGRSGSVPGRRYIERQRELGEEAIRRDYFGSTPVYTDEQFETRFRMPRALFLRLLTDFDSSGVFPADLDCTGRTPVSPLMRLTAAIRVLAYGKSADSLDEYIRVSKDTVRLSLKTFCSECVRMYADRYLRSPTPTDLIAIYSSHSAVGFPGLIGSIDCTHVKWKNCRKAEQGEHKGKEKGSTLILEAVASSDLWIWHSFFGVPGSSNDINVLDQSPILDDIAMFGSVQNNVLYRLNGKQRRHGYYLGDGIYPEWACFATPIPKPMNEKEIKYNDMLSSRRKAVERAFGLLKSK